MNSEIKFSHHPKFDKVRRTEPTSTIATSYINNNNMEGKSFLISIWLLLLFPLTSHCLPSKDPPVLRGGLVFVEEHQEKPLYINQEFYTLVRKVDTTPLISSTQKLQDLTRRYEVHCDYVNDNIETDIRHQLNGTQKNLPIQIDSESSQSESNDWDHSYSLFTTQEKTNVLNAPQVCKRQGARLPEIRNYEKQERVRKLAIKKNIDLIYSGVYLDKYGSIFRYKSDDGLLTSATTMHKMSYGGAYGNADHRDDFNNWYVLQEAQSHPIFYKNPKGDFHLRIISYEESKKNEHIICERGPAPPDAKKQFNNQTNMIVLLAHHNCQRDAKGLCDATSDITKEVKQLTGLNFTTHYNKTFHKEIFFPKGFQRVFKRSVDNEAIRTKRAAPILLPLAGTVAGANVITSIITGAAPLSWLGDIGSAIFGTPTRSEFEQLKQSTLRSEAEIATLSMDNVETRVAISQVEQRVQEITDMALSAHSGIVTSTMEQDLKSFIRSEIGRISTSLLKYGNIIMAAMNGKTSNYAITPQELSQAVNNIANEHHIKLSTKISDISSIVELDKENNTINIYFKVPILETGKLFTLYRVQTLPIYAHNKTLLPEIQHNYIGISKSHSEYITLTGDEFAKCSMQPHDCKVSSPIIPMTKEQHCVIKTYTDQKMKCPLFEKDIKPRPEFINQGNHTIYSVPEPTTIYVKCDKPNQQSHRFMDETTTVTGMGEITFRDGCTITTSDGTKWTTPPIRRAETIKSNTALFGNLKPFVLPENTTIKFITRDDLTQFTQREYATPTLPPPTDLRRIAAASFGFKEYLQFLIQAASVFGGIILTVVLISCCCRRCRKQFGPEAWCPCIPPLPEKTSKRLAQLDEKLEKLESKMGDNLKSFRNSLWSLRSVPSLKSAQSYQVNPEKSGTKEKNLTKSYPDLPTSSMSDILPDPMPYFKHHMYTPPSRREYNVRFETHPASTSYSYMPMSILKNSETKLNKT